MLAVPEIAVSCIADMPVVAEIALSMDSFEIGVMMSDIELAGVEEHQKGCWPMMQFAVVV